MAAYSITYRDFNIAPVEIKVKAAGKSSYYEYLCLDIISRKNRYVLNKI